jgi:hypothetical protein
MKIPLFTRVAGHARETILQGSASESDAQTGVGRDLSLCPAGCLAEDVA